MNRQELLDCIQAGREELDNLWAGLTEAELTARPGPQSDWSVKDLIAHLTYWEQTAVDDIRAALRGDAHEYYGTTDEINAQVFAANHDRALADIQADFARSWRELEALMMALSHDELNDTSRFAWLDGESAGQYLASESYEHYQQHIDDLRAYVKRIKGHYGR